MNLLVVLPLFWQEVFTQKAVASGRGFTRLDRLDNVRPKGEPAVIYQSRSVLECSSFCARDDTCVAVTYHGGQCSIYKTLLYPDAPLPGARSFNKQVDDKYIGCYWDWDISWKQVKTYPRTADKCMRNCYGSNYSYWAGQSLHEHHMKCFCGNAAPDRYKTHDDDLCRKRCPGDKSRTCGRMGVVSVYKFV